MIQYTCTRCEWKGPKEELIYVPVCPDCSTGHNLLYRMMKKGDLIECPSCSWSGPPENALHEAECTKCRDQYLREE
jgi:predicted RNA-binding Zn-ribbon protein involved in translation (DUF1610 family)